MEVGHRAGESLASGEWRQEGRGGRGTCRGGPGGRHEPARGQHLGCGSLQDSAGLQNPLETRLGVRHRGRGENFSY